jgi:hypothetical protein
VSARRVCAYCNEESVLTNEHVFPECFRKTFEAIITPTKTPTGEKAILSALEIRDVCARCNHGPLSCLDTYLCEINDLYFSKIVHPGDRIRFQFDFDVLLRMLLKIGYNVARARKWPLENWHETTQFILGNGPCPEGFHIFLQLTVPTPVEKVHRPVSPSTTEVPPLPMSVYLMGVSNLPGLISGFWVSVWSYRFFVLRENTLVPRRVRQRTLSHCWKNTTGAYELSRGRAATIYASSVEALDIYKDSSIFDKQLSQARKLKSDLETKRRK